MFQQQSWCPPSWEAPACPSSSPALALPFKHFSPCREPEPCAWPSSGPGWLASRPPCACTSSTTAWCPPWRWRSTQTATRPTPPATGQPACGSPTWAITATCGRRKEEEEEAGATSPPACPSVYEGLSCMGTAPWGWQSHHSPVFVAGSGIKRHSITSLGTWAHRQQRKWDFS